MTGAFALTLAMAGFVILSGCTALVLHLIIAIDGDVWGRSPWARRMLRLWWRRWLHCLWTGRHEPVRVPFGWRCAACTRSLADLGEAGLGDGFVGPFRRVFSRKHGEVTRTSAWSPSERGW